MALGINAFNPYEISIKKIILLGYFRRVSTIKILLLTTFFQVTLNELTLFLKKKSNLLMLIRSFPSSKENSQIKINFLLGITRT